MKTTEQYEKAKQAIITGVILVELLEELEIKQRLKQQVNRAIKMLDKDVFSYYDKLYKEDEQITLSICEHYFNAIKWLSERPIQDHIKLFKLVDEMETKGDDTLNLKKLQ